MLKKLTEDTNSANCQNLTWVAKQMVALQRGFDYLLESVLYKRANRIEKRQKEVEENLA